MLDIVLYNMKTICDWMSYVSPNLAPFYLFYLKSNKYNKQSGAFFSPMIVNWRKK